MYTINIFDNTGKKSVLRHTVTAKTEAEKNRVVRRWKNIPGYSVSVNVSPEVKK